MTSSTIETSPGFFRWLQRGWVDKTIAVVALAPFFYVIWSTAEEGVFDIPRLALLIELGAIVVTMLARRPPVRVTANPWFWILAFAVTYWPFPTGTLEAQAAARVLAPPWVTSSFALLSLAVSLWARLSLGRNIGIVPAERKLVTTGAYAFVRHPIYTAIFVGVAGAELSSFTWTNFAFDLAWCLLWVLKTFVEEQFLRQNPEYARYMKEVRWRWLPGVG